MSGLGTLRVPTKVIGYRETRSELESQIQLLDSCSILHQACRSDRCLFTAEVKYSKSKRTSERASERAGRFQTVSRQTTVTVTEENTITR